MMMMVKKITVRVVGGSRHCLWWWEEEDQIEWKEVSNCQLWIMDRDVISQCLALVINNRSRRAGEPAGFYFKKPSGSIKPPQLLILRCNVAISHSLIIYVCSKIKESHNKRLTSAACPSR